MTVSSLRQRRNLADAAAYLAKRGFALIPVIRCECGVDKAAFGDHTCRNEQTAPDEIGGR